MDLNEKVSSLLSTVRPALQKDGGDIELVGVSAETGTVRVRLKGACVHCPMSTFTLKMVIEKLICENVPEIKEVVNVDDETENEL